MVSKIVKVVNAEGMHMRPAGLIAKAVKAYKAAQKKAEAMVAKLLIKKL